jgi:hypothetical protein
MGTFLFNNSASYDSGVFSLGADSSDRHILGIASGKSDISGVTSFSSHQINANQFDLGPAIIDYIDPQGNANHSIIMTMLATQGLGVGTSGFFRLNFSATQRQSLNAFALLNGATNISVFDSAFGNGRDGVLSVEAPVNGAVLGFAMIKGTSSAFMSWPGSQVLLNGQTGSGDPPVTLSIAQQSIVAGGTVTGDYNPTADGNYGMISFFGS